jgi:hypothetical protein
MKELEKLKKVLFKEELSEKEQVFILCKIMEIVGGYEVLMNMPIPAVCLVSDYLDYLKKQEDKEASKMKGKFHK